MFNADPAARPGLRSAPAAFAAPRAGRQRAGAEPKAPVFGAATDFDFGFAEASRGYRETKYQETKRPDTDSGGPQRASRSRTPESSQSAPPNLNSGDFLRRKPAVEDPPVQTASAPSFRPAVAPVFHPGGVGVFSDNLRGPNRRRAARDKTASGEAKSEPQAVPASDSAFAPAREPSLPADARPGLFAKPVPGRVPIIPEDVTMEQAPGLVNETRSRNVRTSTPASTRRSKGSARTAQKDAKEKTKDADGFNFVPNLPVPNAAPPPVNTAATPAPTPAPDPAPAPAPASAATPAPAPAPAARKSRPTDYFDASDRSPAMHIPGSFPASPPYVDADEDLEVDGAADPPMFQTPVPDRVAKDNDGFTGRGAKSRRANGTTPPVFLDKTWGRPELATEETPAASQRPEPAPTAKEPVPNFFNAAPTFEHGSKEGLPKPNPSTETLVDPAPPRNPAFADFDKPAPAQPAFGQTGFGFAGGMGNMFRTAGPPPTPAPKPAQDNLNFVFTPPNNFKAPFPTARPEFGRASPLGSGMPRSAESSPSQPDQDVEMAPATPVAGAAFATPRSSHLPAAASSAARSNTPSAPSASTFTFEMRTPKATPPAPPVVGPFAANTIFDWQSILNAAPPESAAEATGLESTTNSPSKHPAPNMDEFKKPGQLPRSGAGSATVTPQRPANQAPRSETPKMSPRDQDKLKSRVLRHEAELLIKSKRYADAIDKYTAALGWFSRHVSSGVSF